MTKEFELYKDTVTTSATANLFNKGVGLMILNNDTKSPIRIDKLMAQVSIYHGCATPAMVGCVVSVSDAVGSYWDASISGTTLDDLETALDKWRDNIWMTDFRFVGTGSDETKAEVVEMEANTRRLLLPGQKLHLSVVGSNTTAAAASIYFLDDVIVWYSPAAQ